jgi:hypothetical protein
MIRDKIKNKTNLKKHQIYKKKIEIKIMRTKSKKNTNWRTQLNLSKLCMYLRLRREKRK